MGVYVPKAYVVTSLLELPQLSVLERKTLKLEMLLLEHPEGFFKSHLARHLCSAEEELSEIIAGLGAVEYRGVWIHPHYYFNVRDGNPMYPSDYGYAKAEELKLLAAQLIGRDAETPVHKLMKLMRLIDPKHLVQLLHSFIVHGDVRQERHNVSCYLLRHFGMRHQVV